MDDRDQPERRDKFVWIHKAESHAEFCSFRLPTHLVRVPFPWHPVLDGGGCIVFEGPNGVRLKAIGVFHAARARYHGWRVATDAEQEALKDG